MPRAFLITHKRYNPQESPPERETSPESRVNTAELEGISENSLPFSDEHKGAKAQSVTQHESRVSADGKTQIITGESSAVRHGIRKRDENDDRPSGRFQISDNNADEFYNLTKLAEVSLAAAAGQFFWRNYRKELDFEKWPQEQEQPEDLSQDPALARTCLGQKSAEIHACPECGKGYSTSSNLARHRQTHRSLADKKARACPHCDKIYVSMPAYSMHVRTHNQGCKCVYCGKCFSRPWLLQGHIRTHTGEKPFKCTVCDKAFADKSNLRAHIQTHSNMKPHVCGRCGKAFALKSYLYKHEESSCMKTQVSHDRKYSGQAKEPEVKRMGGEAIKQPLLSIPTPVISLAIRV